MASIRGVGFDYSATSAVKQKIGLQLADGRDGV